MRTAGEPGEKSDDLDLPVISLYGNWRIQRKKGVCGFSLPAGLFNPDTAFPELLCFFLRALLAPELRLMVVCLIVIPGLHEPVTPCQLPAVHTGDVLPDLPLCSKTLRGKYELVHPEEDKTANQVGDDRRNNIPHRSKKDPDPRKDRRACLPPEQVESVALVVDLHTTDDPVPG